MGSLFELPPNPDGRPALRYDGILTGAFGQLMCIGCPKTLYGGACPTPAFPHGDERGAKGMIGNCPVCGAIHPDVEWDPKTDTCTCKKCGWKGCGTQPQREDT